jgi:hypothetical protein
MTTTSQQEKIGQVQLSEVGKSNLERNAELWRAESVFVKLEDGEERVLQFNPDKVKQTEGQFGIRIQYAVIDPNFSDRSEKKFEASKTTSQKIDRELLKGNDLLILKRTGEGTNTKYEVRPA